MLVITPITKPNNSPPTESLRNEQNESTKDVEFPLIMSMNIIKNTVAVPPFSKDYPYISVLNWTFAPNYFNKAIIAVGSVADKILPNAKA